MPRLARGLFIASLLVVPRLEAQLHGVPVWPVGLPNPTAPPMDLIASGHTTSGDDFVGSTTRADPGVTLGVEYALGRVTLRGLAGGIRRDVSLTERATELQAAALAGVNLFRARVGVEGHEAGASLVAGYGYSALPGGREQNLIAGVDVSAAIARGGWFLEPALVSRWSWRHTRIPAARDWQDGLGIGGSVTVGFPFGLRFQLAGERLFLGARSAAPPGLAATKTYSWSFAARYRL